MHRSSNHHQHAPAFPYTLLHVKATLDILLCSAAGANTDGHAPQSLFALFDTSRGMAYLYIVVARVCLDVGSHTFAADAFVTPNTRAVREALGMALCSATATASMLGGPSHVDGHGTPNQGPQKGKIAIKYITTDADESMAWFHLLPRLTERSRMWPHTATCAYHISKQQRQQQKPGEGSLGTWESHNPLCTCGAGVGTEVLPERFARVAPYLTRAAFSPLFPVPYLDVRVGGPASGPYTCEIGKAIRAMVGYPCLSCGKEGDLRCSGCKRVWYCSKVCQRADWKMHKKDCGSTFE
ncbi:hypothetical protein J3R83DRAFT_2743 [Lanmaoa asiatica]|nr:hypothetical protein J3R83DRAFT_2743 [Lanmaoa asiatica]